jgi:predicted branched-subunit amino acid permease
VPPLFSTIHRGDLRDALALAAAIAVVGASFGALAAASGVPPALTVAMSLLVFAGGAQFLVVAVVAAGGGVVAAVVAGLLLNLRHLPFGLALGDTVGTGWTTRLLGAHLLIDEAVAFSRARPAGPRARSAYWLCGLLLFTAWNAGTVGGLLAGSAVPDPTAFGVDAAFPAGLLALLLPALRRPDARRVGLGAGAAALLATPVLPPGLPVLAGLLGLLGAGRDAPRAAGRDGTEAPDPGGASGRGSAGTQGSGGPTGAAAGTEPDGDGGPAAPPAPGATP